MKAFLALTLAISMASPAMAGVFPRSGSDTGSPRVPVRDGCGPGFHMNDYGRCRPNYREREREERRHERLVCPHGYHLGDAGGPVSRTAERVAGSPDGAGLSKSGGPSDGFCLDAVVEADGGRAIRGFPGRSPGAAIPV